MEEFKSENWFYCGQCESPAYKFECCGNTTCNGGGCDKCKAAWEEAWDRIRRNALPSPLPYHPPHQLQFDVEIPTSGIVVAIDLAQLEGIYERAEERLKSWRDEANRYRRHVKSRRAVSEPTQ